MPTCQCKNLLGIITTPMPPRLYKRNTLDISVWVEALLDKYLFDRATHRLLQHFNTLDLAWPFSDIRCFFNVLGSDRLESTPMYI